MGMRSALVCFALGLAATAQMTFKTTTNLVSVGFTARDAQGHLVNDLKDSEIEVLQDGIPQKIAFFSRSLDLPLTLGIVMDASASQDAVQKVHASDLEAFLRTLLNPPRPSTGLGSRGPQAAPGPAPINDRAFLLCFGNRLQLVSDFTGSGPTLLWTLQHFKSKYAYTELGPAAAGREEGTALFDAVFYAANEKFAGQNGRRALLLFSDGEDNASASDEGAAIAAAESADATIYTVRYTEGHKLSARDRYGIAVMDRLAESTGGIAINGRTQSPVQYLPQIEQELRTSYELAYYPAPGAQPGFHAILVRCRRPGVFIRARQGFTEPAPTPYSR